MRPVRFDFPVITNSDYTEELSFQVRDTYVDLTGHSFKAEFKLTPNSTSIAGELETVPGAGQQGFYLIDPAHGALQARILWETIEAMFASAYPDLLIGDAASLYYDMLATLPSGDQETWLYGYLNISKGITNG